MARTVNQQMGDSHEADIAEWTKGSVQKASGSQWHRQGDTKNGEFQVPYPVTSDGKSTMGNSIAITRAMWTKIVEQTFNQYPAVFLRFYRPGTHPWQVDIDLAVVGAGFFAEILEAARKWAAIEEEIGHEGELEAEYVVSLLRDAKKWRELEKTMESSPLVVLGPPPTVEPQLYFCPTAEEVESQPGGGFDQCCDRPDLHVPLPQGEGAEKLSQILSDRAKRKTQEAWSAAHPPKLVDGKWVMWPECDTTGCDCCR